MAAPGLEERATELKEAAEQAELHAEAIPLDSRPWWERIRGTFKDDPAYEEAMRLGREYRESLRPKEDQAD